MPAHPPARGATVTALQGRHATCRGEGEFAAMKWKALGGSARPLQRRSGTARMAVASCALKHASPLRP